MCVCVCVCAHARVSVAGDPSFLHRTFTRSLSSSWCRRPPAAAAAAAAATAASAVVRCCCYYCYCRSFREIGFCCVVWRPFFTVIYLNFPLSTYQSRNQLTKYYTIRRNKHPTKKPTQTLISSSPTYQPQSICQTVLPK